MMADTGPIDGSWQLCVTVTDLLVEKMVRVKGDLHIGGVMLQLVESLAVNTDIPMDWSDHALWWPEKKMWLTRTRSTLDQYGVQANAQLMFTPMHKILKVQLPDLQVIDMRADFSINVFSVVIQLCKELAIRHPEELSLSRKLEREDLKKNKGLSSSGQKPRPPHSPYTNGSYGQSNSFDGGTLNSPMRTPHTPQSTLARTPNSPYYGTMSSQSPHLYNGTMSPGSMHSLSFEGAMESSLTNSPITPTRDALIQLYKPKNFAEKARINSGWLDSSRSLFEQEIKENDVILLRFKFFTFYDLNPKYDMVRINQIYEQAKWALISEEIDCTEEEMMMFAALQLQIKTQSGIPQPDFDCSNQPGEDDIDAALTDLQVSLEGSSLSSPGDITQVPELQGYLKFFKPKKFTFKNYKRYYFTFKDTRLSMYRSQQDMHESAMSRINLKGCEVIPDVNITTEKFNIKLFVPTQDGMSEVWIRAETEEQYASWMAACRLASKGKTMADSSYESEVKSLQAFLSLQHPSSSPTIDSNGIDFLPEDLVAPRFLKKLKTKQIATRILEAHANVQDMNLLESKMNFIKAWQGLPEYGITYFIVKFKTGRKEELLGVASNRLIRMDLHNGDSLKTWRYSTMKTWSVNWEVRQVQVAFEEGDVAFHCLTADCKVVHEFLGGYIFLSMRSGDRNQALNQELFHKLTGGWT